MDPKISNATVCRTLGIFEGAGILQRLEFGEGRTWREIAEQDCHAVRQYATRYEIDDVRAEKEGLTAP